MKILRVLAAFSFIAFVAGAVSAAEVLQPERNVLSVSGHETVRIPATRARLTVMIEGREKTSDAAQKIVAQQSTAVLEFLKRSRVDRLQAGALALNPIYETKQFRSSGGDGQSIGISGYLAQWTAAFEVDAERAGELADGAVQAGATRITSFEFTATEDALAAAQREALKAAALRAKEDARAVLAALGHDVKSVIRIHVNTGGPIQPLHRARGEMMMAASAASGPPPAVESGFIEVNGSVSLDVAY